MSGLILNVLAVVGFGSVCTAFGIILGRRWARRDPQWNTEPDDDPALVSVVEARARERARERGTPEAASLAADLAVTGWRTAQRAVMPRRRRRSWKRW